MSDLSFYSKEHGGTFHFLQFNILYRDKFLESSEFKHLLKFIQNNFPQLNEHNNVEKWSEFIKEIQFKKDVIDLHESGEFN